MKIFKQLVFLTIMAMCCSSVVSLAEQQNPQEQSFWKSLKLSATLGIPTGLVYGYVAAKVGQSISLFFDVPHIQMPATFLASLLFLKTQDEYLKSLQKTIKKYPQVPYDHELTQNIGILANLAGFICATKNPIIIPFF